MVRILRRSAMMALLLLLLLLLNGVVVVTASSTTIVNDETITKKTNPRQPPSSFSLRRRLDDRDNEQERRKELIQGLQAVNPIELQQQLQQQQQQPQDEQQPPPPPPDLPSVQHLMGDNNNDAEVLSSSSANAAAQERLQEKIIRGRLSDAEKRQALDRLAALRNAVDKQNRLAASELVRKRLAQQEAAIAAKRQQEAEDERLLREQERLQADQILLDAAANGKAPSHGGGVDDPDAVSPAEQLVELVQDVDEYNQQLWDRLVAYSHTPQGEIVIVAALLAVWWLRWNGRWLFRGVTKVGRLVGVHSRLGISPPRLAAREL